LTIQITHGVDNTVTMNIQDNEDNKFTMSGPYTQSGHVGQIAATLSPPGRPRER
jgi:hypothetical protein